MMEDRQSSRKKQSSGQAQSSRKEQIGRQKQARETEEAIGVLGRVIRYTAADYKLTVTAVLACITVPAEVTLEGMVLIQSLVDDYIRSLAQRVSTGSAASDFSPLTRALRRMAVLYLIGILAVYAYSRVVVTVSQGTMRRLRVELFTRMESLSIRYFDTHARGDIMSVYANDVDALRQLMSQSVPQVANSAVTLTATVVSMLILNIPLSVLTFAMARIMLFTTKYLSGKSAAHLGGRQNSLGEVDGYIEEMMDGQKVVKIFCYEEQAKKKSEVLSGRPQDSTSKANRYANLLMPVNANIGSLSYVLCAMAGGILALSGIGGITVGAVIALVGLNKNFPQPVIQISQQMNSVAMVAADAGRVFELLDRKQEEDNGYAEFVNVWERKGDILEEAKERTDVWVWRHPHKAKRTVTYKKMEGGIAFGGVDFGYDPSKMVLHDTKLFAEPDQKIAFIGPTGAGKTIITNLINHLYDMQNGKIRYGGVDTNKIKKPALHRSPGIVLQDTHLLTGTAVDNIRYEELDATDEKYVSAAKLVNIDSFVNRLPHSYETIPIGNGGSLSQERRQLLAIVRAIVTDPPVLILDEATSSINTRTESLVQVGMDAPVNGRTTFVVAHRLPTIRNVDCIMVMEQGRIIERGSHEEPIGRKRKYYQLYTGNFEEAG